MGESRNTEETALHVLFFSVVESPSILSRSIQRSLSSGVRILTARCPDSAHSRSSLDAATFEEVGGWKGSGRVTSVSAELALSYRPMCGR